MAYINGNEILFSPIVKVDETREMPQIRSALIAKGGNIAEDATYKDVPNAILDLPVGDSSYLAVEDNDVVYRKQILSGAAPIVNLKSIGGMTQKCNQLLYDKYWQFASGYSSGTYEPEMQYGVTFTNNNDGTFTLNGTATATFHFYLFNAYNGGGFVDAIPWVGTLYLGLGATLPSGANILVQTNNANDDGGLGAQFSGSGGVVSVLAHLGAIDIIYLNIESGTVFNNLTLKPMLSVGSTEQPYQPYFEGLKASKVTTIKVNGANLIPYPYEDGMGKTSNGVTFTVNADGSVHAKGTAAAGTYFYLHKGIEYHSVTANAMDSVKTGAGKTFQDCYYLSSQKRVMLYIQSGKTVDKTYYPMINYGDAAASYVQYHEPTTYEIPEVIQSLDGYGHGINDLDTKKLYSNDVDFENGIYTRYISDEFYIDGSDKYPVFSVNTSSNGNYRANVKLGALSKNLGGVSFLCEKFTSSWSNEYGTAQMYRNGSDVMLRLYINSTITTIEQAFAWLKENPIRVRYVYLTPEETDISSEIEGFSNLIEVEPMGTLEFINENNEAIPSTLCYIRRVE